ncbi:hypothetical protein H0H87_000383 [Tephrocybe sp. NHM501043]|nr:hypothetical protein H0H87_000383 [Tephrocybe sp. NHM501043]
MDSDADMDPGVKNDQATEDDPYVSIANMPEDKEGLDSDSESNLDLLNKQAKDGNYDGHFNKSL